MRQLRLPAISNSFHRHHSFTPRPLTYPITVSSSQEPLARHSNLTDVAMSSTTKYQPAPQRDSEEYSQAPPSYQAETSTTTGNANPGMFSGPRSEDDNIPDDFKVSLAFPSIAIISVHS